jgi:hypothetical protein
MVETFLYNKLSKDYDNIAGLKNIETFYAGSRYFPFVNDIGKWNPGVDILRGDKNLQSQSTKSTAWTCGAITWAQWYYLHTNILRGQRTGPVTFQTQRYFPGDWVICNGILDIGKPISHPDSPTGFGPNPFVYRFTNVTVLEEKRMYGSIRTKDASTAQEDITTTPELLTGFTANGEYSGITPAYGSSTLTVGYGAEYGVGFRIDATGTASQTFKFNVRVNAVESVIQCQLPFNATPDPEHTMMFDYLDLDADDVLTVYVESDDADAGTDLTPINMSFWAESVALDS